MLQVGLCTFKFDRSKNRYEVKPFNFNVFPKPMFKQAPDTRFLCQSSSIDFLASHGFDFNKAFKEGIPYLSPTHEQTLRDNLKWRHQQAAQLSSPAFTTPDGQDPVIKGPITIPAEHEEFLSNTCSQISKFLDETSDETTELPACSGYQRKLIYQVAKTKFTSGIHLETKTAVDKRRYILVTRVKGEEDIKRMAEAKNSAELAELEQAVGFSKAMRIVSQSGKLLIGHNMMLDLVHLLHQFYSPLPEDFTEFKSLTRSVFPKLLDTKLMASTHPFKDKLLTTTLGDLRKALENHPFSKPEITTPPGFDMYMCATSKEQLHEAGYDAFITGLCFISMSNFLGTFQDPPKSHVPPTSHLIDPFINKLFLMRVVDIPYMNLAGPDLEPNRDHVFHVSFPKEWKGSDIFQLFSPFGNIQISWINETSAFVSLVKKHQAESVLEQLSHGDTYTIVTYETFHKGTKEGDASTRKRTVPNADIPIPGKKRKSLGSEVPSYSPRSITPIPEEEEEGNKQNENTAKAETGSNNEASDPKKPKLFTEPETW
ncbi:poly(A)-specific ribonuclease PARN-like [Liolophura sinensis]|uniref:poly(A)-specific ribonuclease PARN-like n=1 Tax=Liolophura sinensis TaxID=3198878 RepID=UPI00315914F5